MIFDSPEWRGDRDANLKAWLCGDTHAVNFVLQMAEVAEVWDDLIDGDEVPTDRLHGAFVTAMFDITGNPFFCQHSVYLRPLMMAGINAWLDSVELEKRKDQWSTVWAYALRDFYMELVPACALLLGGFEHMRRVSIEAREFFQAETLEEYANGRAATNDRPR